MSADLAARLRALTHDYHEGRLDLAGYRALRAPLLDSLVAVVPSAADMDITRPRAARPAAPAIAEEAPAQTQESRRMSAGPIVIAVAVAAVVGTALWFFFGGSRSGDRQAANGGHPETVTEGGTHVGAVHGIVIAFTERADWSDARLTALNASLLEAGEYELARTVREDAFQRFVDELRRHLKERQALATTPLTPDNSAIAALAVTVGLDLNSPDAAIRIASVQVPRPAKPAETHASGVTLAAAASQPTDSVELRDVTEGVSKSVATAKAAGEAVKGNTAGSPNQADATPVSSRLASLPPSAGSTAANTGNPTATTAGVPVRDGVCRPELIRSRRPLCSDVLPTGEGPLLALVPAGSFEMGSAAAGEEQPQHRVAIAVPFAISVNEVSQVEFRQFCQHAGRSCAAQPWTGDDYPVVNVTWSDARAYAEWLSSVTHQRYRLPSEAQWEYAARAGQTGPFPGGDTLSPTDAHFSTSTKQGAPARRGDKFKANGFRLLHTLGNVREWVEDAWVPGYAGAPADGSSVKSGTGLRVARGGSYADGSARLRLSLREGLPENTRDPFTGFRVVRELP